MALQSSGAISLANVQTEFGGSNPIGINEYYGVAAGVPASGTISLYDFYGKSATSSTPFTGWTTQFLFGSRSVSGTQYTTTDNFSGNIVTPGAGNSPQTFNIFANANGYATLEYYQGGSLNTTWSTVGTVGQYFNMNVTLTFGSSSMQFRSAVYDSNTYDNYQSATSVFTTLGTCLYIHQVNQTGSGFYGRDD
jgi:hypothetical protein